MPNRRTFFGSMTAGVAALPWLSVRSPAAIRTTGEWDLGWLDGLKGVHRQVFDVGPVQEGLLHVVKNWLDAHNEVFGLADDQLSAVVGLASRGFPANAGDALWERYAIGERYKITDPDTKEPARRNVFLHVAKESEVFGESVPELVRRGVIFWQCNNALRGMARRFAANDRDPAAVYQDLRANLLPHVKLIPAHTMLVGLCQEHGCTYEALT